MLAQEIYVDALTKLSILPAWKPPVCSYSTSVAVDSITLFSGALTPPA